jgi:ribosomal-protein-alanine N-acetyltransferase
MWYFGDEIHLGTLVTHPAVRQKGIGEFLLVNIINRSLALSAKCITLEVRPSNRSARALYTKYGFEVVGRRKKYYHDREDAIIMTTPAINSEAYQALLKPLVEKMFQRLALFQPDITDL